MNTPIGDIVNKPQEAKALIEAMDVLSQDGQRPFAVGSENERVRAYMANPS